jgi:serralysin
VSKKIIPDGQAVTFNISSNYEQYILEKGATMSVADGDGIVVEMGTYGDVVTVNGTLIAAEQGADAIAISGAHATVNTGADAELTATTGIYVAEQGLDATIDNAGSISSQHRGISVLADGVSVRNAGVISSAEIAINAWKTISIVNSQGAEITGDEIGIVLQQSSGGTSMIRNDGTINGGTFGAVWGSEGAEKLINRGTINGSVALGAGDDIFDSRGGLVSGGDVSGQAGDDVYRVAGKLELQEGDGQGFDRVYSSISWKLTDNFEAATLTGKANTKLIGNDASSQLTGNAGNNRIAGMLGGDIVSGGRGNDILTGDDGVVASGSADVFLFGNHCGRDVITDFHDGEDAFNLAGYKGLDSFGDLKGHIKQVGDNVVMALLDGDQFTLRDVVKADLNTADFVF